VLFLQVIFKKFATVWILNHKLFLTEKYFKIIAKRQPPSKHATQPQIIAKVEKDDLWKAT
jgi:hypothetical protein